MNETEYEVVKESEQTIYHKVMNHFLDSDALELKWPYKIVGKFIYKNLSNKIKNTNAVKKLMSDTEIQVKEKRNVR